MNRIGLGAVLLWLCHLGHAGCCQSTFVCAPPTLAAEESRKQAHSPPLRVPDRDGFEGQALASFWLPGDHGSGRYAAGAIVFSDEQARSGNQSAKITVREGDVAQRGDSGQANERAELDSGERAILNQDAWCGFSFLIPRGFPIVTTRLVISQWKQSGLEGSPIVAQRFSGGRHYLTIRDLETRGSWREAFELPSIAPGRWNDMVFHTRFAHDSSGVVEVWMNGQQVARYAGPTASTRGRATFYHKVGLYRDRMAAPMTLYLDNYAMGSSFDEVDPMTFGR